MERVTKDINIRFIGDEKVVRFSIDCLRVQLEDNIRCRRKENYDNINIIEAYIKTIK